MGGKSTPAPQPDWAGMVAAQNAAEAARMQFQLGQEQLAWAKDQYAQDKATNKPIIDSFIRSQDNATNFAKQQQDFYTNTYQPLEAQYAATARDWASPDRVAQQAGAAQADVAQQFEGARQAAAQQLKDYGIDPSSGRYAATDLITRTQQGAAQAAAGTNTSNLIQQQALGLQQNAINIGRGYPGAIATTMGTANNSGNSAIGGTLQTTASGANTMGTGVQWTGLGNQAQGMAINGFNNAYNGYWNAVNGYNQSNNYSSGIGSALGLIGGAMVSRFMADGGAVPPQASPTAGAAIDDVPAQLTAGEFVLPKDTVEWIGQREAMGIIAKARKERAQMTQQTGAIPDVGPATNQPPTFVSRPQMALPA